MSTSRTMKIEERMRNKAIADTSCLFRGSSNLLCVPASPASTAWRISLSTKDHHKGTIITRSTQDMEYTTPTLNLLHKR